MSGTYQGTGTPGRIVRSSPGSGRPLKAVIPVSSLLKQGSSLGPGQSPPGNCWRYSRLSPDHPGQRSPGAAGTKGKSKTLDAVGNSASTIRRTASLDTIYLKGQWPRDHFYWYTGILQIDKATQTEDIDWTDPRNISISNNSDDRIEKKPRQRLRSNNKESNGRHSADNTLNSSSQTNTSCILSPTMKALPLPIPLKPLPKSSMRSSVEGLNQEIEHLVLVSSGSQCSESDTDCKRYQTTPEGHRAPLAEILRGTRSRSVNTQTPGVGELAGSCQSSGPPSRGSMSPSLIRHFESANLSGSSQGSTPDQEQPNPGTSPHINRFLAREPPDGCERVHLKALDEVRTMVLAEAPQPCTFKLRPSLGSAFQLLKPGVEQDSTVQSQQHQHSIVQ